MNSDQDELLTPAQVSELIGMPRATVYYHIQSEALRAHKRGGRYLVSRADAQSLKLSEYSSRKMPRPGSRMQEILDRIDALEKALGLRPASAL